MKQIIIFLVLIQVISCEKEDDNSSTERSFNYTIKEFKTNKPLKDVAIHLLGCERFDWQFGCIIKNYGYKITDANGEASFTVKKDSYTYWATAIGNDYWSLPARSDSVTFLDRMGSAVVNLIPSGTYPSTAYISISVNGEQGNIYSATDLIQAPSSSKNITIKTIAGQVNNFKWVVCQNPGCYPILAKGEINNIIVPATGSMSFDLNF